MRQTIWTWTKEGVGGSLLGGVCPGARNSEALGGKKKGQGESEITFPTRSESNILLLTRVPFLYTFTF